VRMRLSDEPGGEPRRRSSVAMRRDDTVRPCQCFICDCACRERCIPLYSKLSCSLKNSLNAGSEGKSCSVFGLALSLLLLFVVLLDGTTEARRLWPDDDFWERHICASSPSICRRPFRSFALSFEDMLSKARERSVSMMFVVVSLANGTGLPNGNTVFLDNG